MTLLAATLLVLGTSCSPPETASTASASAPEPAPDRTEPPSLTSTSLDPALTQLIQERRDAVRAKPSEGAAWGALGQAFHAAEFPSQAIACYQRATSLDPQHAAWWHLLAVLELQDSPTHAFAHFARAIPLAPSLDTSRFRLAQALLEHGQSDEAVRHLDQLLLAEPDHAAARLVLARVRLAESRTAEAETLLQPCLTNPYTAKPAMLLKGQARLRQGQAAEAEVWTRRATALPRPFDWPDPHLRQVQDLRTDRSRRAEQIQNLLQQRRIAEAEPQLDTLLAAAPDDPEGLLLLGRLRLQQRRCAEAEVALRRHLTTRTQSLNGWVQLGMAHYGQTQWMEAAQAFETALRLKPDFAQAHYNLGLARSRAGQFNLATESFRESLRCSPGDLPTLVALAEELIRSGAQVEARTLLERALALEPRHPKAAALLQRLPQPPRP
ncbi:MAG: tetratricopeptide repeat protein [Verrucomicrobiales bacterium]|nr:tetratricopeptide repeat protein [Verrucomicrobiales bacterium]